jgi:DNA/RNA-binding domain of Phe-tRNA-synthetase-like protein
MRFVHAAAIWREFPELRAAALAADGITATADVPVDSFLAIAAGRDGSESELPEIQAWRRAFSRMGLKPTQYRCASEALLRRFRKEGSLPPIHPLIDLCNAVSLAFAIPVAVFDRDRIDGDLEVRRATGREVYTTFAGEDESPEPGEVIFADAGGRAHARRWTNRQSGFSAVRAGTSSGLIVAEALHETAEEDIRRLADALAARIATAWHAPRAAILTGPSVFET